MEIGAASGYNFKILPNNTILDVVDCNEFFHEKFKERMRNYENIILNDYKIGMMEDLKFYKNDTFDVVLATSVLCSVQDVPKSLKEVRRVLKPVK